MHSRPHSYSVRRFRWPAILLQGLTTLLFATAAHAASLAITTTSLPAATAGVAYSRPLIAIGGTAPYTWTASAALPAGLTLGSTTGVLSGTVATASNYLLIVKVTDAVAASRSRGLALKINASSGAASSTTPNSSAATSSSPLATQYATLDPLTVGTPYTRTVTATGGTPPYKWSISAGTVSPGMSISPGGIFSGTPTTGGDYKFTLTVTDVAAATASAAQDQWVGGASSSGSSSSGSSAGGSTTSSTRLATQYAQLDPLTVGTPYTRTVTAIGGTPPYKWSISAGTGTPGMSISTGGVFSGTPTAGGDYKFTLTVTDAAAATASFAEDQWVNGPSSSGSGGGSSGGGNPPPPPTTYSVTVVNGTGTGSYTPGTTVTITAGAAPAGQWFKQWTGSAPTANAFTSPTTFTMPSGNVTETANFYTPAPITMPVTTHPRLWVTPNDVTRLRSWASPSNPIYQQGLVPVLNNAIKAYNQCFPGGQAAVNYPDPGDTQGYVGIVSEQQAMILAFNSLIDPNPAARVLHAQRARALLMYAMNQAVQGHLAGAPFRDPMFAVYNRANANGECWALIVDWLQGVTDANGQPVPILTAQDKATLRLVFLTWANDCLNASTTGGDHPGPIGQMNNASLLPGGGAYRMAANNYYLGHARLLTMMSLSLDAADDPAINPALPDATLGNTLRSYIADATGAWLYQEFAMFADPATVRSSYGLGANASVGLASGGLPPEGMLYGHSFAYVLGQLLALQTAGFNDPARSGPQISLIGAPVWDRFARGYISSLTPAAQVFASDAYMGPIYQMASYGDLIRLWITPDMIQPYSLLALLEQQNGSNAHADTARWFATNAVEGGGADLLKRVTQPWNLTETVLYFMLFDPAAPTPTDPRPGYATTFTDALQGRVVSRTAWAPGATMFDFRASWISINHQDADAGQFEFYRNGEWLTKEASNYDAAGNGQSSIWHNTLALQNWNAAATPTLSWFELPLWLTGSQYYLGQNAGDPVTVTSTGPGYTFAQSDLTKLYNHPQQWTASANLVDIQQASRAILWVNRDYIVVYDRGTSLHAGFKRFNLNFTTNPVVVNNHLVTATTPGGQQLFVQSLLPANAAITVLPTSSTLASVAWLEPTRGRIVVEDPTNPTDIRFLHVLQGADAGAAMTAATLVSSTGGTPFDGAVFGDTVVLFKHDPATAFAGVTYTVPTTTVHHYVTGLAPNAGYSVITRSAGSTLQVNVTTGGSMVTDSAGVLTF